MSTIREGKAEVVDAVRTRLAGSSATLVTEYRGLTVAEMATLRRALRAVGGDYKVFKNTLVRRAIEGGDFAELAALLEGPTAIAFVSGDVSAVAKALRDFARGAPALVLKGGVIEGALLDARQLSAIADLPSREVLLSQLAGVLAAPMRQMATLLQALPQNLAYGLAALLEQRGGERQAAGAPEADAAPASETGDDEAPTAEGEAPEEAGAQASDEAEDATAAAGEATEATTEEGTGADEAPVAADDAEAAPAADGE